LTQQHYRGRLSGIRCDAPEHELPTSLWLRQVVGPTDPSTATASSLRGAFREQWQELGLEREPFIGANCVHASAGPVEGLKERLVWSEAELEEDELGAALLKSVGQEKLTDLMENNPVCTLNSKQGKIFDLTEGMNTSEAIEAFADIFKPSI